MTLTNSASSSVHFSTILDSTSNCVIFSLEDIGRRKASLRHLADSRPQLGMPGSFLDKEQGNSMASKMSNGFGILENHINLLVTLGKLINLTKPQVSHLKNKVNTNPAGLLH